MRRSLWPVAAAVASACCFSLAAASLAAAAVPSFGAEGEGAGEFRSPRGIAVGQTAGEVFVVDQFNKRVDVFTTGGAFLRAFGWGVAVGTEALQTCTSKCFSGFKGDGAGEFSFSEGAAVDNGPFSASNGDIYVWDAGNLRVQKLAPSGEFILAFGGEVNVATEGDVCLAGEECRAGTAGSGPGQFEPTAGNPIAVDAVGTVYVGDRDRVQEFSQTGSFEGEVSLPGAGSIEQLAVDASKDLYVKSSELSGVRKYDHLAGTELGLPRDETGAPGALTVDASEELFVDDGGGGVHHVLEFDAEGEQLASFGAGGELSSGIAFDEAENAIYAMNQAAVRVIPVPPAGPLVVSEAAEALPTTASLTALVNPEGPETTSYHFEYGTTAIYGSSSSTETLSGEPFADQTASAALSSLQPNTLYHFRVVVSNAASETTAGVDQTFMTLPAVSIDRESVSQVSAFSARLEAELNPHGAATDFRFEYGPTEAYGETAPIPSASAGSGTNDTSVGIPVQNLAPNTVYHYRVVAHNSFGTSEGADRTFTTQTVESTPLIDGRAWEMVSPPDKQGVSFEAIAQEGAVIQAAEDGHAITYIAKAPITENPEGNRSIANDQVLSTRKSPGAWASGDIATKHEEVAGLTAGEPSEYKIFSPELATSIVEPHGATPLSDRATERTPYRREADGTYNPVLTAANVVSGVKFGGEETEFAGRFENSSSFITATPDQSHILLTSPQGLTPGVEFVENAVPNVFEWNEGTLQLVSILPNKTPTSQAGEVARVGRGNAIVRNAFSDNGNRISFETTTGGVEGHLYLRDMALGQTVQLDATEAGLKKSEGEPKFQTASSDGSRVFFLDDGKLTPNSTAREGSPDLYECEVTVEGKELGCTLKDLSVDINLGESANVLGVPGADGSGRLVYFMANGRLAANAVAGNCRSEPEATQSCNLYERDTVDGTTRLVAVLSADDFRDWEPAQNATDLGGLTSRVSPNGQYLAFMSERPLTGFDNRDAVSGERDEEVFEYSLAGEGTLACVSCASSGTRPHGVFDPGRFPGLLVDRPDLWQERWVAASIPGWTRVDTPHALYQSRYLSDSGRMFFNSATPLLPSDANGLEDVYEYEPAGVGGCDLQSGCQGLISSGTASEEAAFMDASADGSDVFFLSSAQLSGKDLDSSYDLYDAHLCSAGAPCAAAEPVTPPSCATADACRAAPVPQPDILGAPPSQSFSGAGNIQPPPATKALTRAQKLTKALGSCKKVKPKAKKAACVKRAKKLYGPVKKKATKKPTKKSTKGKQKGRGKR